MKITEALIAEHAVFTALFDYVERVLPNLNTLAEVKMLGGLIEALLDGHGDAEENLVYVALDHALDYEGRLDQLHQEHGEIDTRLKRLQAATDLVGARRLLKASLITMREHFLHEEKVVFPVIEKALLQETLTELGHAWRQRQTVAAG
jgi:hemerythrin-like domain-containing protein